MNVCDGRPLQLAVEIIAGRWRAILVCYLLNGPKRFSDLQKETGISRRMLTVNLKMLEEAGVILRTAYPEVPPRVEYQLTPDGLALCPILSELHAWRQAITDRQLKNKAATTILLLAE